jgi:hypothetical protein
VEIVTVVVVVEVVVVGEAVKAAAAVAVAVAVINTNENPKQISQMSSSASRATVPRRPRNKSVGSPRMCCFA